MRDRALRIVLVGAIVFVLGGLVPPGAAAQPQPTLKLNPSSGPCDATIEVEGAGFLGQPALRFYLLQPGTSDTSADFLNSTYVNQDGAFKQSLFLDKRSCDAAALDAQSERPAGRLTFAVTAAFTVEEPPLEPGERIPGVIAVAEYEYTTTITLRPQPMLVLSPSSGPCDGTVEVTGTNFRYQPGLKLYVVKPGTESISMGMLGSGVRIRDGSFSQAVGLHNGGCEAAALDSQAGQPTGHLVIAGSFTFEADAEPGERIRNIVAVAEYTYSTTVAQPQPTMVLSPSSGPCDATLEVTGHDFTPNAAIVLYVGAPKSDGRLGTLATLATGPAGEFSVTAGLGVLGCRAAGLDAHYSGYLSIGADFPDPAANGENILTRTEYTYTTTTLSPAPQVLPSTGTGVEAGSGSAPWLLLAGILSGIGLLLVAASLHRGRRSRT